MDEVPLQQTIAAAGGMIITLALAYVPRLKEWWGARSGPEKRGVLALSYLVVAAGLYLPACTGGPQYVACDISSVWDTVMAFLLALAVGQSAYTALPDARK